MKIYERLTFGSVSSDWAPPLSLSSDVVLSFRFRIWWSSLSKSLITTVLVKPLSQRPLGHFCCNPCVPPYHSLTHFWQPIRLLHPLHAIRGFLAGILLQMIHEKVFSNSSKKDALNLCLNARSWNLFISIFISWISSDNVFSCVWIPCCLWGRVFAFFLLEIAWFQFLASLPRWFSFVLGALQPTYLGLQTLCGIRFSSRQYLMKN